MEYRILIVSEDAAERNRYAETLISLPRTKDISYQIATVGSVAAAQLQATRQRFQLVIVALGQHDDGLDLSTRLKELFPDMRLLLLCEQGVTKSQLKTARLIRASVAESTIDANSLRAVVSDMLGTSALIEQAEQEGEPVQTTADRQAVQQPSLEPRPGNSETAATESAPGGSGGAKGAKKDAPKPAGGIGSDVLQPFFDPFLDDLRRQAHAQVAIVTDKIGRVIGQNGEDSDIDVVSVAKVIASSSSESLKMDGMLQDANIIHFGVHEGKTFDVYSANVGQDRVLALFFNKYFSSPKLGLVLLVMKRGVEKFSRLK